MKVYIATNKDNKDSLMHYGVKGMRWGKRGGMSKNPEDYSDTQSTRRGNPKDKYDGRYGLGHQRIALARQRVGNEWTYKQVSPGKISRKNNVSNGARPQQNKLSTSQKTSSAPDKRIKQYFRDKIDRQRADERNWQQFARGAMNKYSFPKLHADEKKRAAANWDLTRFKQSYPAWSHGVREYEREQDRKRQEQKGKKHTRGIGWLKDREYNDRKTYRR